MSTGKVPQHFSTWWVTNQRVHHLENFSRVNLLLDAHKDLPRCFHPLRAVLPSIPVFVDIRNLHLPNYEREFRWHKQKQKNKMCSHKYFWLFFTAEDSKKEAHEKPPLFFNNKIFGSGVWKQTEIFARPWLQDQWWKHQWITRAIQRTVIDDLIGCIPCTGSSQLQRSSALLIT